MSRALLLFHLRVGSRLALRALLPVVAAAGGGMFFLGDDFFVSFSRLLFGKDSQGGSGSLLALAAVGAAATAAPRICRGLGGWMRHLPIDGRAQRRAALLAIAVAQAPLFLGGAAFSWVATGFAHLPGAFLVDLAGLLVCAPAAALVVMPVERPLATRPLALAATFAAVAGGGWAVAAAVALLAAADAVAGGLRPHPPTPSPIALPSPGRGGATAQRPDNTRVGGSPSPGWGESGGRGGQGVRFEARIAFRALRWRLLSAWAAGLLPLGAAFLFVRNNELMPRDVRLAGLLGGACAVVFAFSDLAEALGVRRPAWPWARSLPWSAAHRVRTDAFLLAAHAVPLLLVTARIDLVAAVAVLAVTPWLALRAAGAVRRAPERRTGASGEVLLEGGLLAAALALLPWLAPLALAATPWAWRAAAEREREQRVSRWLELHHLAVGDPQSWSSE